MSQTEEKKKPDSDRVAAFLLTVLVVVATPVVLVPALLMRWVLGRRWPDRLVAALLAVLAAAGLGLLMLGDYLTVWKRAASWALSTMTPWLQGSPRPAVTSWVYLAGVGLLAGTVYGAVRWLTAQAKRESDLYDGLDAREERLTAEERRRRKITHAVQQYLPLGDAKGPFVGIYQRGNLGGESRYSPYRRAEDRLWRRNQLVRLPLGVPGAVQHVALLGATGMGKSELVLRLAEWSVQHKIQVVYLSGKEPTSPDQAVAPRLAQIAESLGGTSCRVLSADYPYDPMRGDDDAVRDRLVAVEEWRQDYWRHSANFLIGLALNLARARGEAVASFPDLVHSLTPDYLKSLPPGSDPNLPRLLNAIGNQEFSGAVVRYGSMALNLKGWIDSAPRGWSFEDADVIAAELPMATRPEAGRGLLRMMIRDFGSYIADPNRRRRNPDGSVKRILLIIEEVGAVSTDAVLGREFTTLVERARSAGVCSVFTAQGPGGLGPPEVQEAIFTNTTVMTFRQTVGAEQLAELVGTKRVNEASRSYDTDGLGVGGSTRRQYAHQFSPDYLRGLVRGEAVLISGRKFCSFAAAKSMTKPAVNVPIEAPRSPYAALELAAAPTPVGGPPDDPEVSGP